MIEKMITIRNKTGLHARPAAIIVQKANEFQSDIFFEKGEDKVNAKSIMGVMMLAAAEGSTLKIVVSGKDEREALEQMTRLLESDIDKEVKT